ncbi:nuclear GTPase SLIP-GC-like [Polypterus senegalus]|uniref:nuclear GTPase SLIP-GC-like n=1 Tax=Polypterus senegalus TaxID=55291 RepID=UPI001965D24F|nr:nuclear GTPase SLIP-GC-like [Polypterus senegalus]
MDQNALIKAMQQFISAQQEEAERQRREQQEVAGQWRKEIEAMTDLFKIAISKLNEPSSGPLVKMTLQDDPEAFLKIFERVARHYCWPEETWSLKLAPLLCGEAQLVYANLDDISAESYTKVKEAILHCFRTASDLYKQQFYSLKFQPDESPRSFAQKLKDLADKWLRPMETEKMKLFDKVVLGQFLLVLPKEVQERVQAQYPKDLESAIKFAEELFDILSNPEEGPSHQRFRLANDLINCPTPSCMAGNVLPTRKKAACVENISPRLQQDVASSHYDDNCVSISEKVADVKTSKEKLNEDYSPAAKKQRRTCDSEEPLTEIYKMVEESRNAISRIYEKVKDLSCTGTKEASFLAELKEKIENLKERNISEKIFIGIYGRSGSGKSSLINALLNEICLLPTSSRQACTSCIVQVQAHGNYSEYRAEIEFISKEEWEEELKELVENCKEDNNQDDSETEVNEDTEYESAKAKITAVYGKNGLNKSFSELTKEKINDILNSTKTFTLKTASQLSKMISPYIRCDADDETLCSYWPLVKVVNIFVPRTPHLPSQVVLVDLPGTEDPNKEKNKKWKECFSKCSFVWFVTDIHQAEPDQITSKILNTGLRRIVSGGECRNITIICTKADETGIGSDHNILGISGQTDSYDEDQRRIQSIHVQERNSEIKRRIFYECNRKLNEHAVHDLIEVFTLSSTEYWNNKQGKKKILTYEKTELPLLREHLKMIHDNQNKKVVENYVSEVSGVLYFLNVPKENAEDKADENEMLYFQLSKRFTAEANILANFFDNIFKKLQTELMEGVAKAETKYINLHRLLNPETMKFIDYHQTIQALCRNSGIFRFASGYCIDLNKTLALEIYEAVDNTLQNFFRFDKKTRSSINAALNLFQQDFQQHCYCVLRKNKGARSHRCVFINIEV